jgi:NAD+--dinitrogen-reductase ADP-D-ribosyltransferase
MDYLFHGIEHLIERHLHSRRHARRSSHHAHLARLMEATDPQAVRYSGPMFASLPRAARLPINRCNLPAVIIGSPTFQRHPVPLVIDGVVELHRTLFERLDAEPDAGARADLFSTHMRAEFSLGHPEEAGHARTNRRSRIKADYPRLLRGWAFDADSREGAVLKGWVESRFGLLPRHHGEPIRTPSDPAYLNYQRMRAEGLYATNSLEAQLDLLYSYSQYELHRQHPHDLHITLYRGVNHINELEVLQDMGQGQRAVLMNSLSSFTNSRERAGEFGDYILTTEVPLSKVFFFHRLLPGLLKGEDEFVVVGGIYEVSFSTL